MADFYSDKSASSTDLMLDLDPPGAQQGVDSVPPGAPLPTPPAVNTEACGISTGPSLPTPGVSYGAAGSSGTPATSSGFAFVPPYGGLNMPGTPYLRGPGQLYAHGSPGLAATYMSPSYYGAGMFPVASQPRMSLAPDLMFPHQAFQPYGNVQDLLAQRAHLDHTLASLVSFMFFFLQYNTLGVAMTLCIAPFLPTQSRC